MTWRNQKSRFYLNSIQIHYKMYSHFYQIMIGDSSSSLCFNHWSMWIFVSSLEDTIDEMNYKWISKKHLLDIDRMWSIYIFYQLLSYDFSLEYRSNWYIHLLLKRYHQIRWKAVIETCSIRDPLIIEYSNECDWWRALWSSLLSPLHHRDPISSDWMKWE